ncbi:hypothetical protein GCM10015535_42090 [Streptomyces gelaticus]|uniref:Uncharacterized protein n=1 Tax=Streptomyces gelaticus TaxID=285446 RepID=A0ABQ2W1S2_9ACTN|nr:hypothetical protein GCM10015535_42090 [Streptomyces gelaticus]
MIAPQGAGLEKVRREVPSTARPKAAEARPRQKPRAQPASQARPVSAPTCIPEGCDGTVIDLTVLMALAGRRDSGRRARLTNSARLTGIRPARSACSTSPR